MPNIRLSLAKPPRPAIPLYLVVPQRWYRRRISILGVCMVPPTPRDADHRSAKSPGDEESKSRQSSPGKSKELPGKSKWRNSHPACSVEGCRGTYGMCNVCAGGKATLNNLPTKVITVSTSINNKSTVVCTV